MRRLHQNTWRLSWVLFVNTTIIVLLVTALIREYRAQGQIFKALGRPEPSILSWSSVSSPWTLLLIVMLVLGMLAELRRSILSLLFNLIPFVAVLIWWAVDLTQSNGSYAGERSLGSAVAAVAGAVLIVNATLFAKSFRNYSSPASPKGLEDPQP